MTFMTFMTFGQVNLPEKVDLIVSEVVGNVATGEGVVDTIRDARRRFLRSDLLKDPEAMIPRRCQTAIAPVTGCHVQPGFVGGLLCGFIPVVYHR